MTIGLEHYLIVSVVLFCLGLLGVIIRRNLIGRRGIHPASGIVEQNVQSSPFPHRFVECRVHGGRVGHIARQDQRIRVTLRTVLQAVAIAAQQPDLPSLVQEQSCGRATDAAACAGDQDRLAHAVAPRTYCIR